MGQPALRLVVQGPASGERRREATERDESVQSPVNQGAVSPGVVLDGPQDAELVGRAISGERWAFEQLYRRHADFAFSLAVRLQGGPTDVEDIVHDAFLRAHAQLVALRDRAAFRSWLGSIVVSHVRMRLRRSRWLRAIGISTSEPVDLESLASPSAGPEVRAELAQLYALLRVMPADERIAWTLRNVERNSLEEVAQLVDCSLATAKRRIQRAQRFLQEHFVSPSIDGGRGGD